MTKTNQTDQMPHLNIETLPSGLIRLENESMGDSSVVDLHLVQLRYIAEKAGLIAVASATEAELLRTAQGRLAEMCRDLDRYKRTILALRDRSAQLHENIFSCSQLGHTDMGIEVAQSAALADIADMLCAEFEDHDTPAVTATERSAGSHQLAMPL